MSSLAEKMIGLAVDQFNAADQRRSRTVFTVAGRVGVATPGEKIIYLPNGVAVKVTTDESGTSTQVEEDEALHAIVRPRSIKASPFYAQSTRNIAAATRPRTIRTTATRPGG